MNGVLKAILTVIFAPILALVVLVWAFGRPSAPRKEI